MPFSMVLTIFDPVAVDLILIKRQRIYVSDFWGSALTFGIHLARKGKR